MTFVAPPELPEDTDCEGQLASDWAVALLQYRGCPVNTANVYSFAGWFAEEGGGGSNNPMNSTLGDEYPAINSAGVRNYPTSTIGVEETWATLDDGYTAIEGAFHAGVGLGNPSAAVADELGEWSGGGYYGITPRVVPMPPTPSYHYGWYDATKVRLPADLKQTRFIEESEVTVVKNYDKARKHPKVNAKTLELQELKLARLVTNIENAMKATDDPKGLKFHREYRLVRCRTRANGGVVEPDLG